MRVEAHSQLMGPEEPPGHGPGGSFTTGWRVDGGGWDPKEPSSIEVVGRLQGDGGVAPDEEHRSGGRYHLDGKRCAGGQVRV